MNNTANKKDIFYIIVLILTFITVIIGATFALYTFVKAQEEGSSAVYTGTLAIEYLKGDIINCNLLYPTTEPSVDTEKNVYKNNFKVTNTGSLDSLITISLDLGENAFASKESLTDENECKFIDEDNEKFLDGVLEYSLYSIVGDEKHKIANGALCKDSNNCKDSRRYNSIYNKETKLYELANNIELEANTTVDYILLIWIHESGKNQSCQMKKNLTGRIIVDAIQET